MLQVLLWALAIVGACYLLSLILPWDALPAFTERTAVSDQAALAGAAIAGGAAKPTVDSSLPEGMAAGSGNALGQAVHPPSGGGSNSGSDPTPGLPAGSDGDGDDDAPTKPDVVPKPDTAPKPEDPPKQEGAPKPADTSGAKPPAGEQTEQPKPEQPSAPPAEPGVKQVALTFDDGPDKKFTPKVLEILKQYGVKATFFVVGTQVEKYPAILKQIEEEGHTIGNHTYGHANLPKLKGQKLLDEIEKADALIEEVLGKKTPYFRAPYGAVSDELKKTLKDTGRELVGWNVDTRDWAGTEPDEMLQIVKDTVKPGGIILMHSFGGRKGSLQNTIDALPSIIEYLQDEGYTLVPLTELSRS